MGRKNGGAPFRYLAIIGIILCTAGGAMAADPVRIMPCGDSITYGNFLGDTRPAGLRTGYRQPLWLLLQNAGYNVDFVGSVVAGDLALPAFDPDNEGHPGWTDAMIAENIYGWLTATPADIVVLHIGTNAADVQDILDEIDRYEGDTGSTVTVLLARIINRVAYSADTTLFNDNVEAMANARIAAGDDIVMVDMEDGAGLDYALDTSLPYDDGDMYDDLHPNDRGYGKMAAKWYQHLVQILPPGVDADSDGIPDDVENAVVCLDPNDDDSDDDGILDGNEDTNRNGVVDPGETDPCNPDSDGDSLTDGLEIGLTEPQGTGTDPTVVVWDEDPDTTTDPLREDTVGDGLRDGEEDVNVNGDSPVGDGTFTGSVRDYFGVEASMTTQMSFLEGSSPDIDNDGVVDGTDLALLVKAYNSEDGDDNYNSACDIIPNNAIDQDDLEAFAAGFGITDAVQGPITFTSNFDNGNGTNFTESPDNQINFKVEIDPAPADILWNKWFHIRLDNVQGKTLSIRPDWSGDRGMTSFYPYLYTQDPVYGYDGVNWTFVTNTYWSQPIERFTVPLSGTSTNSTIYVAAGLPYTYGMLQNDILSWQASGKLSTSTVLGASTYGRNIYYMVLGTGSRGVGITARTHPNEATGSYYLKGIMDFLTSDDPAAVMLRSEFTFHVFPMVNPDGVYLGKTRSFASGEDANRDFDITGPNASTEEPETYLIHQRYHQIKDDIVFHIDCHTNHTEPMMWRDSATFPSALESQIVSRIGAYESTGIVKPTFTQWDVPETAWMGGVKAEYGIDAVTFEGGIFRDDQRNGHVTASELEQIGKGNLQACLNGYLAYESNGATGNDFTGDSDVAAVYGFEPGALGADDSGNGNTLTAYNSPASDTTNYKRGSGSVSYVRNDVDYQLVSDANLASGFPLKSTTGEHDFSITSWMRFPDYTYQMGHIINKYSLASHERQFALVMDYNGAVTGTARSLFVYHGYDDGGDYAYEQVLETDTQLSPDTWYFIHLTYLASTNTYTIRAWDDTAGSWLTLATSTDTAVNDMSSGIAGFALGCRSDGDSTRAFQGNLDEVVVWNRVLNDLDANEVKDNTFNAAAPPASTAVVQWDGTSSGLDVYDATDGGTTTESGVTFSAEGAEFLDSTNYLYFTATNGNNIDYDRGTIEFKFKATGAPQDYSRFFQHGTDFYDFSLYRDGTDSGLFFRYNSAFSQMSTGGTNLWDGIERTVRVTWDTAADQRKLYIDDALIDTLSETLTTYSPDTTDFYVGCASSDDRQAGGIISDFQIWNTVEVP